MPAAPTTAGLAPQSAPPKQRPGRPVPERILEILGIVSILAAYGRHLAHTLERRAVARGFATIAQYFGTVTLDTILAHLQRGLMRAIALERLLLGRAARGRDLQILTPRGASYREQLAPDAADAAQQAGSAPPDILTSTQAAAAPAATPEPAARPARRIAGSEPLSLYTLPSMEAIEAEVRRSPIGRTIAAICRDLGISPALCDGTFWNRLFDAIRLYRGSLGKFMLDVRRQEQRFEKDEWRHPRLELPEQTRDGIRRVLGFRVGEDPVDPFVVVAAPAAGVAAAATGPP